MSDTDDGFDEEAARRELREKYEAEQEDREATARMSELLLQGATMTNQHCDRCGSPIFRYDGQEFCPTCQHEAQQRQQAQQQQETGRQSGAAGDQPAAGETGETADQQSRAPESTTADQSPAGEQATGDEDVTPAEHASRDVRAPPSQSDAEQFGGGQPRADRAPETPDAAEAAEDAGGRTASGDAAAELDATIGALARRAADADDPRTAKEYLEAAREAAETLAVLE